MQQQESGAMAQAVEILGQMIAGIQQGQQQVADAVTAPKQVIRDESGRISGVRTAEAE